MTVSITTRTVKSGKRYVVRYRLGGRAFELVHAGSFPTLREARMRRDLVAGELAAGRDPRLALREPRAIRTLASVYETWRASRIDVDRRTLANYSYHWKRIEPTFGAREPETITHLEVQDWVNAQALSLTPAVVRDYTGTLAQLLDFAGVDPNPARHRLLRLPRAERKTQTPPTDRHVLAILDAIPRERRLLFAFLEQTGARISETLAWTWGDLDQDASRILSRPETVKGRRGTRKARWVQVPEWLLDVLLDRVAPDDRSGALFPWPHEVVHPQQRVDKVMRRACELAGIPHFHPHDFRHRRISLWHGQGVPAAQIGERVGQRNLTVTNEVYSHVMPLEEIGERLYREMLV